ncbi:MAG: hypothetical protein ABI612_13190 [Betaproteobacteria bacterium]
MKNVLLAAALAVCFSTANANVVRYELNNVALDDGGAVSGFWEFDADAGFWYPHIQKHSGKIYGYDLKVTGGLYADFEYTPATSTIQDTADSATFANPDLSRYLDLTFSHCTVCALGQVLPNVPVGTQVGFDWNDWASGRNSKEVITQSNRQFVRAFVRDSYMTATAVYPSREPIIVPEPSAWAMLTLGMLGITAGIVWRSARKRMVTESDQVSGGRHLLFRRTAKSTRE